jgi:hypothetical protein
VILAFQRRRLSPAAYARRAAALTGQTAGLALWTLDRLRALPRPRDVRIDAYLATSTAAARLFASEADALAHADRQALAQLNTRLGPLVTRSRQLARDVGFRVCGH